MEGLIKIRISSSSLLISGEAIMAVEEATGSSSSRKIVGIITLVELSGVITRINLRIIGSRLDNNWVLVGIATIPLKAGTTTMQEAIQVVLDKQLWVSLTITIDQQATVLGVRTSSNHSSSHRILGEIIASKTEQMCLPLRIWVWTTTQISSGASNNLSRIK